MQGGVAAEVTTDSCQIKGPSKRNHTYYAQISCISIITEHNNISNIYEILSGFFDSIGCADHRNASQRFITRSFLSYPLLLIHTQNGYEHTHHSNSMQQIASVEANRFSASQEIPRILWNPKFITAFTRVCHLSLSSARSI